MINMIAATVIAVANLTATNSNGWICTTLDRNPNDAGVTTVAMRVLSEGYSAKEGAELIVNTVASGCPKYLPVLQEWAEAHG